MIAITKNIMIFQLNNLRGTDFFGEFKLDTISLIINNFAIFCQNLEFLKAFPLIKKLYFLSIKTEIFNMRG